MQLVFATRPNAQAANARFCILAIACGSQNLYIEHNYIWHILLNYQSFLRL